VRKLLLSLVLVLVAGLVVSYALARSRLRPLDDAARARAPGAFARLPDGQVHYHWHGPEDGRVVVLAHGFSTPSFVWQGFIDDLGGAGLRALAYDHYGRGWSDRPRVRYDADLYDRQILGLLADQDVSGPVDLVGYSMGGAVAAIFAERHPERVRRLVLIAPAGFPVETGAMAQVARAPLLGEWLMTVLGPRSLRDRMAAPESQGVAIPDLDARYAEQMSYAGYMDALLSTLRHFPLEGLEDTFAALGRRPGLPVLAIWGDRDEVVPTANAELLRAAVPQARIEILPGATHAVTYSRPEEVGALLVEFLAGPG
jgi:pimeloyl-ACP methyl ester carboxylesterase